MSGSPQPRRCLHPCRPDSVLFSLPRPTSRLSLSAFLAEHVRPSSSSARRPLPGLGRFSSPALYVQQRYALSSSHLCTTMQNIALAADTYPLPARYSACPALVQYAQWRRPLPCPSAAGALVCPHRHPLSCPFVPSRALSPLPSPANHKEGRPLLLSALLLLPFFLQQASLPFELSGIRALFALSSFCSPLHPHKSCAPVCWFVATRANTVNQLPRRRSTFVSA